MTKSKFNTSRLEPSRANLNPTQTCAIEIRRKILGYFQADSYLEKDIQWYNRVASFHNS